MDAHEPQAAAVAAAQLPSRRWMRPDAELGGAASSAGPVAEAREHQSRSRLLPRASPALDTSQTGAAAAGTEVARPPPVEQPDVEEMQSWRPAMAAPKLAPRQGANMAMALSRIESLIAQLRELVGHLQAATADVTAMSAAVARWTEAAALVAAATATATGLQQQVAVEGPAHRVMFLLQLRAVLAGRSLTSGTAKVATGAQQEAAGKSGGRDVTVDNNSGRTHVDGTSPRGCAALAASGGSSTRNRSSGDSNRDGPKLEAPTAAPPPCTEAQAAPLGSHASGEASANDPTAFSDAHTDA
mgnify:CR=1 FL=1